MRSWTILTEMILVALGSLLVLTSDSTRWTFAAAPSTEWTEVKRAYLGNQIFRLRKKADNEPQCILSDRQFLHFMQRVAAGKGVCSEDLALMRRILAKYEE